jgi:prepilin-type processing-associated H-X9-DG protein
MSTPFPEQAAADHPHFDRKKLVWGIVQVTVVLLVVLLLVGILLSSVAGARHQAQFIQCQNNLKQIGLTLANYHSTYNHFPAGTIVNKDLPIDRRLSWMVETLPYIEGGVKYLIDTTNAWDDPWNNPPLVRRCIDKEHSLFDEPHEARPLVFHCPSTPSAEGIPMPTSYVGVAGLGESAAELPLTDRRIGVFGYDRTTSLKDIKDGASETLMVAEVADGGAFTAGGHATVRGLAAGSPYLGAGGQFSGSHSDGKSYRSSSVLTNVLFADGHIRPLSDAVSPTLFEALATIAGGEQVGEW